VEACDRDCELAPWTEWSLCSKACGGGVQQRTREVKLPPVGLGTCPSSLGFYRFGHRTCNPEPCVGGEVHAGTCKSDLDMVLLMDGSGSIDSVSWYYMQKAGAELVKALTEGKEAARVAVQVFGGVPASKCLPFDNGTTTQDVDPIADCGIQWLSHLTETAETVAGQVPTRLTAMSQPAGSSLLSEALGAAETELTHGREAAASVVAVITAGLPLSPARALAAAQRLKQKARLVVVPVMRSSDPWPRLQTKGGKSKPGALRRTRERLGKKAEMLRWPTRPVYANFLAVSGFETLSYPWMVQRLVDDFCPAS